LTEILSLVNPPAFGRAERIRRLVAECAATMEIKDGWQIEVAAMLSQIGCVAVPETVLEKIIGNGDATDDERDMFDRHAQIGSSLIARIPRMEAIAAIIADQGTRFDGVGSRHGRLNGDEIPIGARLLKAAIDFDGQMTHGASKVKAVAALKGRPGHYD